jgi:type I restriction enzyme S subunit
LDQLVEPSRGISYGIVQPGKDDPGGVPIVRVTDVRNGQVDTNGVLRVAQDIESAYERTRLRGGEVLLSLVGTLGECAIASERLRGWNVARAIGVIPVAAGTDPHWIALCLRSSPVQALMRAWATTTVQATLNLREVRRLPILMPPEGLRTCITETMCALENKMDQNRRTARALERLARAIFRAWFVDFEPVKAKAAGATAFPSMPQPVFDDLPARFVDSAIGPAPAGWDVLRLDDLIALQRGFDLPKQSRADGSHPVFAASGLNGWHSEWKVKGPGVTTGRSGVLGQVFFVDRDFWPLNTSLWVKEYKRSNPWHAYFLLQTMGLAQFNAGSAVPTLNRNHVHSLPIVAPPEELLRAFEETCRVTFALDQQIRSEIERLAAMRDYLLPTLLSGDVRVKAAHG